MKISGTVNGKSFEKEIDHVCGHLLADAVNGLVKSPVFEFESDGKSGEVIENGSSVGRFKVIA